MEASMEESRERLAGAMEKRARQLRLRWVAVADRAGMSVSNLVRIRNGEITLSPFAIDGIDAALEWEAGEGVEAVLDGRDPTPRRELLPDAMPPDLEISPERWARWLTYEEQDRAVLIAHQRARQVRTRPARSA